MCVLGQLPSISVPCLHLRTREITTEWGCRLIGLTVNGLRLKFHLSTELLKPLL